MNERKQLEDEIEKLKYELSVSIPEEINEIMECGGIQDSTEISSILQRQQLTTVRLNQLISRLNCNKNISLKDIPKDAVGIGSLVTVLHKESGQTLRYKIVATDISDIIDVTPQSPIGKALYNKQVNDEVVAYLPIGKVTYAILDLKTIHQF